MRLTALLVVLVLVAGCSPRPPEDVAFSGGCAPESSPFLARDLSLLHSRISYCERGDASVSRIEMSVPAQDLATHRLVIAGYPESPGVEVTLASDAGGTMSIKTGAGDAWTTVAVPEAFVSGPGRVTVIVDDQSTQDYGWAGVGIALDPGPARDFRWAAMLSMLLFTLILGRDLWKLHREKAGGVTAEPRGWIPAAVTAGLLGALTFAVALFRRPDQIFNPYIWVEEGTVSLPQFLENGAAFIIDPVAGYLIIPSKLLFLVSTAFPVEHFPQALAISSIIFCWLTLVTMALAPSHLKATASIAAFVLVLPTASENYFTAHYAFWFGSLLLIPALFWKEGPKKQLPFRVGLIVLGGFSSPLVVALLPGFFYRVLILRTSTQWILGGVAGVVAMIQLALVRSSGTEGSSLELSIQPMMWLEKFFGLLWSPVDGSAVYFGFAIIAIVLAFLVRADKESRQWYLLAIYCVAASILITVARVPAEVLHPIIGAPRYFFYPYIFLAMVVLGLLPGTRTGTLLCAVIMAFCLARFPQMGPQPHVAISWQHHLDQCVAAGGDYLIPVHYYGSSDSIWHVQLDSEACRRIADGWADPPASR
jgi:hypothetical protein